MDDTATTTRGDGPQASGRHPVDIGHLVMGIAFAGMVGVWALFESDLVDGTDLNWFLPLPWLRTGAAGLAAVVLASRRRSRREARTAGATDESYQPYEPYQPYQPHTPYEPYRPEDTDPGSGTRTPDDRPDTTEEHR
jgi:hypothetical protein